MKYNQKETSSYNIFGLVFNSIGLMLLIYGITHGYETIVMTLAVAMIVVGAVLSGIAVGRVLRSKK